MFRFVLPVMLSISCVGGLSAQSMTACSITDDNENCNRVVACVGGDGLWFNGRAFGRGTGTFSGVLSDGGRCEGTWVSRNAVGIGQAEISCDDGRRGQAFYTYQDSYTGTAIGRGILNTGEGIKLWSGNNVLTYLRGDTGVRTAMLPCRGGDIPMS